MRLPDQAGKTSSMAEGDNSLRSTPTLDDDDDPFNDPELTRMHFEGIDAGEIEMRAQSEALRE